MKIVTADITGSLIVNGVDVTSNVVSSSVFSGSIAGRVTSLEQFSASLDATFATDASVTASILVLSQSVQTSQAALSSSYTATSGSYVAVSGSYVITSGSYAAASASLSIRVTNTEATASTNTQASASFAAQSASLSTRLTTDETNITTLTNASSSFAAQSASLSTRLTTDETNFTNLSSSFATTSGSLSGRVTIIEGQDATTGSNIFTGTQRITEASNAISFTSTASLYTDGGLRVSKDSYVSGTAYFNNVVVYGTSSIQYITSSQVNFGTNIITVNTDTPAVRFGGLAVFDSGSTQLTGSMLWDSEKNHWIYSNPSGSTYNSAMLMNGPRNTGSLGTEQGTTACYLMAGQGGDHITSSMIYHSSTVTCIPNTLAGGVGCFSGAVCAQGAQFSGKTNVVKDIADYAFTITNTNNDGYGMYVQAGSTNNAIDIYNAAGTTQTFKLTGTGVACFAGAVCAPSLVGGTMSGTTIYGSTAVCSPVGKFTSCIDAGSGTFSSSVTSNSLIVKNSGIPALQLYRDLDVTVVGTAGQGIEFGARNGASTYVAGGAIYGALDNPATTGLLAFQTLTAGSLTTKLTIASTGIACFACQVCAPSFISSGTITASQGIVTNILGLNVGNYNYYSQTVSGAMGILGHNVRANGSIANQVDVVNSGWISSMIKQYYNEGITFHTSPTMYNAGDIFPMDTTQRLRIGSDGISCFAATVCAPIITSNANSVSLTGTVLLTTLATDNALYIITAQPEAGSGTSAAALVTSRSNQNPSVQTIVSSSSLSFVTSGYNICLCSNLGYALSARWGIIRLA